MILFVLFVIGLGEAPRESLVDIGFSTPKSFRSGLLSGIFVCKSCLGFLGLVLNLSCLALSDHCQWLSSEDLVGRGWLSPPDEG